IKYIYQKNSGVSSARNKGILNATYEWVAFLDSDDEWLESKLEKQVHLHKENSDVLVSYTDENWIREGVEVKIPKKFKKIGEDAFVENVSYCNIAPSSVLMRKSVFEDVGGFDEELEVCEDYDLWLRVALKYKIVLVDEKLINKYAGHENQLSFRHWGMDRFRVVTLEKLLSQKEKLSEIDYKLLIEEIVKKYNLLLKGAIKYDRKKEIEIYKEKIAKF
ncbi:MAG: glycosyltransferase, partial [Campylobacterota bacterium]|nr:glycosyltransferase [Campylobacterota bacterium]